MLMHSRTVSPSLPASYISDVCLFILNLSWRCPCCCRRFARAKAGSSTVGDVQLVAPSLYNPAHNMDCLGTTACELLQVYITLHCSH